MAYKHGLADYTITTGPSQKAGVSQTTAASTIEVIIGTVWMDSGESPEKYCEFVDALKFLGVDA
jgi:hypothetical protein